MPFNYGQGNLESLLDAIEEDALVNSIPHVGRKRLMPPGSPALR
jgi:hypothetical protein